MPIEVGGARPAADIPSSNSNNTLATTNLQTQVDELSDRTDAPAIKTAYESNADTNAFTDAEQTKLSDTEIFTLAEKNKLDGIELLAQENKFDFVDAPSDGQEYLREDGAWVLATAAAPSLPDISVTNMVFTGMHLFAPNDIVVSLAGNLTVEDSSVKTIVDDYGILQTLGVDDIRVNRDGALLEGEGTNLLPFSEDLSTLALVAYLGAFSVVNGIDPDVFLYEVAEQAISSQFAISQNINLVTGKPTTFSVDVQLRGSSRYAMLQFRGSSPESVNFDLLTGLVDGIGDDIDSYSIKALSPTLYRLTATITPGATEVGSIRVRGRDTSWGGGTGGSAEAYTGNVNDGLLMSRLQVSELPFPNSYIKTTGSPATRLADNVSVPVKGNLYSYEQGDHWQSFEVNITGDTGNIQTIYSAISDSANQLRFVVWVEFGVINYRDGSTDSVSSGIVFGTTHKVVTTTESGVLSIYVDGALIATTINTPSTTLDIDDETYIGNVKIGTLPMYGTVKNFRSELGTITADEVKLL